MGVTAHFLGDILERILKKIIYEGSCWIWSGAINTDGYPRLYRNGNGNIKGHRYVYESLKGEIPKDFVVRHVCDNILCLNPDHLIIGTQLDNIKDRVERKRTHNHVSEETEDFVLNLRSQGLSQKESAKIAGCSQMHVSKMERGIYQLK